MLGRIREMVRPANDMADVHVDIIYDDAQMKRWQAIRANQHEVFNLIMRKLHISEHNILKFYCALLRYPEAHSKCPAFRIQPLAILWRQCGASTIIFPWLAGFLGLKPQ